jgi:two-component system, chemotaxis family, protein-glutamate methylesterase/glutaminase
MPTTVLVVDDSALMRRTIREILSEAGEFEVITACSGADALGLLEAERPDVVTLDVNMPVMDGLACLAEIMKRRPTPVVMVSSLTEKGALATLEALNLGAVDFVPKPGGTVSLDLDRVGAELVDKVRRAAGARVRDRTPAAAIRPATREEPARVPRGRSELDAVLIGASTGGPGLVGDIVRALPQDFPAPIVIAQHLPSSFTKALAQRLDAECELDVQEVTAPVPLEPGNVYIGRGDGDVVLHARAGALLVRAVPASPAHRWHPSVDRLVASARAAAPPRRLIGVLLTGMGDDGAQELAALRAEGGRTIAEAAETAVVWGMPGELVRRGGAELVLPAGEVAGQILAWAYDRPHATTGGARGDGGARWR